MEPMQFIEIVLKNDHSFKCTVADGTIAEIFNILNQSIAINTYYYPLKRPSGDIVGCVDLYTIAAVRLAE